MRFIGECPHCGKPLEFTLAPPPVGTCASCAGRYTIAVPELVGAPSEEDVELLVLPSKAEPPLDVVLEKHGLVRPILLALIAGGALAVVFPLLAFTGVIIADGGDASIANTLKHVVVLVLVDLPLVVLLSPLVARLLFEKPVRGTPLLDAWRSSIAIAAGSSLVLGQWISTPVSFASLCACGAALLLTRVQGAGRAFRVWRALLAVLTGLATFALAIYVPPKFRGWLWSGLSASDYYLRYSTVLNLLVSCAAGWITARVAARAPYRHVLGAVLVVVLSLALVACLSAAFGPIAGSLIGLIHLPLLLFGAWLSERAPSGVRARASA